MNKTTAQRALDALKKSQVFAECTKWDETYKAHHAAIAELEAVIAQPVEPVDCQFQGRDGRWHSFIGDEHKSRIITDGTWPIRHLFAAPQEPAAPGWLPISQAPKDGTQYLAYAPSHGRFIENQPRNHAPGEWTPDDECINRWFGCAHQDNRVATLFQPLPPAPGEPT